MTVSYVVALLAVVLAIGVARLISPALPLRWARARVSVLEGVLIALGVLALAAHCGAMFYPAAVRTVPGAGAFERQVNALGLFSIVAFAIPAALLIIGITRVHVASGGLVTGCLTAVGVTMYDGGSLTAHLSAIFVTVVALAVVIASVVGKPRSARARG